MRQIVRSEALRSDMSAVVDDRGNKRTYRELAEKAESFSEEIEERSLIFILCDRQMETVEFIYEVLYLNRVPLLLDSDIDLELLDHLMSVYRPQYIYCHKSHDMTRLFHSQIEFINHGLLRTGNKKYTIHPDVALLLSTSGTTGSPKLVKISYDNLNANAEQASRRMKIQAGQKGFIPLPINHVYGFTFYVWHWYCGAAMLVTEESVFSNKFDEFYQREKVNNFGGTPYTFRMLKKLRFWTPEKLEYLHWAMSAGVQMSDIDQADMVSVMKKKFWIMYGQTESTGFISCMNFDVEHIKFGSVGKPLENIQTAVERTTDELILKSRNVSMGYARNMAQLAEGDVNHGKLHTGDRAFIDEDGCIYLKGRLTRYVKILGKRVSLDDVGVYLESKFPGIMAACTGKDDCICIFYSDMPQDLEKEILRILDRNLKIPKQFVSCVKIESIPRNSVGKIMYAELEKLRNDGESIENM